MSASTRPLPAPAAGPRPAGLPAGTVPVPLGEIYAVAQEYIDAGRLDAADRMLGHILAPYPNHADALHAKGLVAYKRGRLEDRWR